MRLTIHLPAADGHRFAVDAFSGSVGKPFRWRYNGADSVEGLLVSADVEADGSAVELTVDVPPGFGPSAVESP